MWCRVDDRSHNRRVRIYLLALGLLACQKRSDVPSEPPPKPSAPTTHATAPALAGQPAVEGDFAIKDFAFASGDKLELKIHYTTYGHLERDAAGHATNAVLIMHGTTGSGMQFTRKQFADVLFGRGQLLDLTRYYVILPDDIGHGQSSKPSDGMHAKFPSYGYRDMVAAEHALVSDGLHVDHLRLVMGTSMGCMHSWMWLEAWPAMMDAAMPLACLPVAIAGRNRQWRKMVIDAIRHDPAWKQGDYTEQPRAALSSRRSLRDRGKLADHRSEADAQPRRRGSGGPRTRRRNSSTRTTPTISSTPSTRLATTIRRRTSKTSRRR